ncbi:SymE family type I addiction module toxin [Caballeronia sp. LZ008]|nr:SymE family type I addiction module toxin [Caballeronia sp. LZ008]MDR5795486.1 SymE family type I addiction module toxin [Caballeronia sp. LZ008]
MEQAGFQAGQRVKVNVEHGRLIITPSRRTKGRVCDPLQSTTRLEGDSVMVPHDRVDTIRFVNHQARCFRESEAAHFCIKPHHSAIPFRHISRRFSFAHR